MKNPLAVRQQGVLDLKITSIISLRNIFPYLSIGRSDHKLPYTAMPTFELSRIKVSQL